MQIQSECTCERNLTELRRKLEVVLATLNSESENAKEIYLGKISELYEQIRGKSILIEQLEAKLSAAENKATKLEWTLIEKESVIEGLHQKVRNLQGRFKENLQNYVDQLNITMSDVNQKASSILRISEQSSKRINISQYFIKAVETSKHSTKIGSQYSNDNTTFSNKADESAGTPLRKTENGEIKLQKVRSLDQGNFRLRKEEFVQIPQPFTIFHDVHLPNKNIAQLGSKNIRNRLDINRKLPAFFNKPFKTRNT